MKVRQLILRIKKESCINFSCCGHNKKNCGLQHHLYGYSCTRELGHSGVHIACVPKSNISFQHNLTIWHKKLDNQ